MKQEFRAWYKPLSIMCQVAAINFFYGNVVLLASNDNQRKLFEEMNTKAFIDCKDRLSVPENDVVLMQNIGFKDKNSKEIYTSDILKVETGWYKSNKECTGDKFDNGVKGITYWSVEHKVFPGQVGFRAYGIDRRFNKILTPNMIHNNNAVICGNIYDNPELLQEVE